MGNSNKLIVANWKCYPETAAQAKALAKDSDWSDVVIAPSTSFLGIVKLVLRKSALAAQNCYWTEGAFTGEVSPKQLKSLGVTYVIIGHSERRQFFGDTDLIINKKIKAVIAAGLQPILCVGESWLIRKEGLPAAKSFIANQLSQDLKGASNLKRKLIVVYEPIWAISPKGRVDRPADAVLMLGFIKDFLNSKLGIKNPRVLYGGSVTSRNAADFLALGEIDGLLVGGASRNAADFKKIIRLRNGK
ncbi:MAG: triose-phosphate isomerase [bacterium]|nr:triose-phosphate isomerase [bacterium]